MVLNWHQASSSVSGKFLEISQVGGLLRSELWLYAVAGHFLYVKSQMAPAEEVVGVVVHHLEDGYTIFYLPSGMNGEVGL